MRLFHKRENSQNRAGEPSQFFASVKQESCVKDLTGNVSVDSLRQVVVLSVVGDTQQSCVQIDDEPVVRLRCVFRLAHSLSLGPAHHRQLPARYINLPTINHN